MILLGITKRHAYSIAFQLQQKLLFRLLITFRTTMKNVRKDPDNE